VLRIFVSSEENDQTIISFIKRRFKSTPLSLIYKLLRTKKILVNKVNCRYYHHRLKSGDEINIDDEKIKPFDLVIDRLPVKPDSELKVVYEDQNLLIVIKEHNVEINKDNEKNCLDNQVRYHIYQQEPDLYQKKISAFFSVNALHRLDKLTEGLVIYAKNAIAKKILYNSIQNKQKISKSYLAVCESLQLDSQIPLTVQGFIHKNELKQKMEFNLERSDDNNFSDKSCSLQIKKIFKRKKYQLLEITLDTGRKHQIRAILSFLQMPIIGDKKYGSKIKLSDKIYLFAYLLEFNDLPTPLDYLNGKIFKIPCLEKDLELSIIKDSFA
jgi:23S rRNA pseudouridine955/2504/2580 synthase